jgi:hypothetical protein
MGYIGLHSDYSVTLTNLINVITGIASSQNYRGSPINSYISFRTVTLPRFLSYSFPALYRVFHDFRA